jgi:hypothetical protein
MHVLVLGVSPPAMAALSRLGIAYDLVSLDREVARLDTLDTSLLRRLYRADYRDPAALALTDAPLDGYARVLSFTEYGLFSAAVLNVMSGTADGSLAPTYRTRNKYAMRRALTAAGLSSVRCGFGRPPDSLDSVVCKPVGGSSSVGVLRRARPQFDAVPAGCYWEEYLPGPEFSVECVSRRGHHDLIGVTGKVTTGSPHYIEVGHLFPADVEPARCAVLASFAAEVLTALGVRDGASHTELKLVAGGPQVIEVHTRPGGDSIPRLAELVTGIDQYEAAIRAELGLAAAGARSGARACGAASVYSIGDTTVQRVLAGVRDSAPNLVVLHCGALPGDGEGSDARTGHAVVTAPSRDDLAALLAHVAKLFDAETAR